MYYQDHNHHILHDATDAFDFGVSSLCSTASSFHVKLGRFFCAWYQAREIICTFVGDVLSSRVFVIPFKFNTLKVDSVQKINTPLVLFLFCLFVCLFL